MSIAAWQPSTNYTPLTRVTDTNGNIQQFTANLWIANHAYVIGDILFDGSHYQKVTAIGPTIYNLIAANDAVAGNTTYEGTIYGTPTGAVVISGFVFPFTANNGSFTIVSNTPNTLVVNNPSGVAAFASATATVAGFSISGPTVPTWNDSGGTTTDGSITWTDQGVAVKTSGSIEPSWATTFGASTSDNGIIWQLNGLEVVQLKKKPLGPVDLLPLNALSTSNGSADAGSAVLLNASGLIDPSLLPSGSSGGGTSGVISLNDLTGALALVAGSGVTITPSGTTITIASTGGGSSAFDALTSGTNTTAAMVVGTGASLTTSGGEIETTDLATTGASVNISNSTPPAHAGQLLISQPGNATAVWADPLVQGLYPEGTATSGINPVLVSGKDTYGNSTDLPISYIGSPATPAVSVNILNGLTLTGSITADQGGVWTVGISPSQTIAVTNTGTFAVQATQVTSPWVISGAVTVASTTITGTVAVTQSTSPWITNIEASGIPLTATIAGSPAVEALNVYVVNSGSTVISGTVSTKTPLTPASPIMATVGTSSAQVLAANTSRKGLVLVNTSSNYISFGIGVAAVLYSGITLSPYGGVWTMDEYSFSTDAINAIASAATSNLGIQEFNT